VRRSYALSVWSKNIEIFDQPSRRNRLGYRFSSKDHLRLINNLYKVVSTARTKDGTKGYGTKADEVKDHINQIVCDLYAAWIADPNLVVGYSRKAAAFKSDGMYYGNLKQGVFLFIIDTLAAYGFIKNYIQNSGYKATSSRMRCTQQLVDLIEGERLSWASIIKDPAADTIILKSKKDSKGIRKTLPFNDTDDPRIPEIRQNLEEINSKLSRTLLNLFVSDDDQAEINKRLKKDTDTLALDFTQRHLYRVFNNDSWDEGGRFYGGWWQSVPSEYRKYIQIEGKQTVEWDYSSIHPTILYAKAGETIPNDAYDIPDWDRKYRDLIKKAFNQLINSDPKTKPKSKWRTLAPDIKPDPLPDNWTELRKHQKLKPCREAFKNLTGRDYDELLSDIIKHHSPIADVFFSQTWGKMQRLDSDIAEGVMMALYAKDIVVLPIHDSFIVRRGFEGYLKTTMNRVFQEHIAAIPGLKSDKQNISEGDWLLENENDCILSGSDMIKIGMDGIDKYKMYGTRQSQWRQHWGLEGWD